MIERTQQQQWDWAHIIIIYLFLPVFTHALFSGLQCDLHARKMYLFFFVPIHARFNQQVCIFVNLITQDSNESNIPLTNLLDIIGQLLEFVGHYFQCYGKLKLYSSI